jgi:Leucine-rich repeat (LRR) protein
MIISLTNPPLHMLLLLFWVLPFALPLFVYSLLQNNNINGRIPEIGRLTKLKTLDISSNQLSGEIPSSVSRLTNLQYL